MRAVFVFNCIFKTKFVDPYPLPPLYASMIELIAFADAFFDKNYLLDSVDFVEKFVDVGGHALLFGHVLAGTLEGVSQITKLRHDFPPIFEIRSSGDRLLTLINKNIIADM
jgi:hypothetical protein